MRKSGDAAWAEVRPYKFLAPTPYVGVIPREGILQRIAQSPAANVILLQGPAGHGKSTALQQLKDVAEAEGRLTGWLTFDAGDNDPRRFVLQFEALVSDLVTRAGVAPQAALAPRQANRRYRTDRLIDRLDSITQPVSLFFDECQALTDTAVLAFFKSLLECAPERLRIFMGSRSLPDVGLARLVVNNRAVILRGDDLRFTPQEVEAFFAGSRELGIDLDEVDAIYQRTEGWPAALQLFRLTLGSPSVRRSLGNENARAPRELAEYLAENVLALQPPRIQDFLLRTSKLARLSASLCDEVLGWSDSGDVLLQLERSGMFLRCVDPQEGWFKYHTLFSSILAEQLQSQSPGAADEIHRRAAHWYMQHDFFEEAVQHATICKEHSLAADALNLWSSGLVAGAHLRTVELWSERIPFDEIAARRDLAIKVAYALVFLRRRQRAKPLLDLLAQWTGTGSVLSTTDPRVVLSMAAILEDDILAAASISSEVPLHETQATGFAAFELGAAANLRAYCALTSQEVALTRDYLAQARVYNDHVNATFSRGYTIAVSTVSLLLHGHLKEALARFREEISEQQVGLDKSYATAVAVSCYLWVLYEANDLATAESLFSQNQDIISGSTRTDFLTAGYLSMSRVYEALGNPTRAEMLLDEAEHIGRENQWTRLVSTVQWERVRRALLRGAKEEAIAMAAIARVESSLPPEWIPIASELEGQDLGEIRLALAVEDLAEASARIEHEFRRQNGRVLRQMKLHLLAAVLSVRSGDPLAAQTSIRAALQIARPAGFVRSLLDEGPEVHRLLRQEHKLVSEASRRPIPDPDREFLEVLLHAIGAEIAVGDGSSSSLLPLTDRECEMLVLLSNGISNKGIANRLFVSENTVKFHLKNIYAKLSVTSRVQAVTAARQIGIVH